MKIRKRNTSYTLLTTLLKNIMATPQTPLLIDELGDKLQFKTEEVGLSISTFFQKGFGIFLCITGVVGIATGISQIEPFSLPWFLVPTLAGVLPAVTGGWLLKSAIQKAKNQRNSILERKILKTIVRNRGNMTPQQIAFQLSIPLDVVNKALEQLYGKGMLESQISEQGVLYYELSEALTWDKKLLR